MRRRIILSTALAVLGLGGAAVALTHASGRPAKPPATATAPAVPVVADTVKSGAVPIYLYGIGTVQAYNTVVVRSQIQGELTQIPFVEGQTVHPGDLLAQIDPRPYQAQLDQAMANRDRDQAQLANAEANLQRYLPLLAKGFATPQLVDTQKAQVAQIAAAVKSDEAIIESAQVQLGYTRITAPIDGVTGIRQLDIGNIIHPTDPNGLVVVTQLQPISVIFSLSDQQLRNISREMANGPLKVIADGRTDHQPLGEGTLTLVDNVIDQGTGTIRLKATFPNEDHALWPGQFINIRLLLRTLQQVVTVPSTAIQRGPNGMYVYLIKPDSTVAMQPVSVGQMYDGTSVVERGLQAGDKIVVRGQYRLQPGSRVQAGATAVSALGGM